MRRIPKRKLLHPIMIIFLLRWWWCILVILVKQPYLIRHFLLLLWTHSNRVTKLRQSVNLFNNRHLNLVLFKLQGFSLLLVYFDLISFQIICSLDWIGRRFLRIGKRRIRYVIRLLRSIGFSAFAFEDFYSVFMAIFWDLV
jgi:hypothetical protein